mgnify:CR=1 FL=1
MKRVGRWTWMLLTLLLLLCASVLAADEKTYIELDETVEAVLTNNDRMDFYLDIPVDGMRMLVDWQSEETCNIYISGKTHDSANTTNTVLGVQKAGEYTVTVYDNSLKQGETRTVRFMLREYKNDAQEPNDVTPTELHDGDAISFTLDGGDRDQFAFTTTKPGQDIALTFGGFYYADRTSFKLSGIGTSYTIDGNGTVFLHAGEPGAYQFSLYMFYMSGDGEISRSMEVHLLDGDENELNDSLDYDFYTDSSSFHLKAKVADGIREWNVQRTERGPFGCDFKTYLGDQKHSCSNHCMFCFIDQLPPGMRESLYFKDDDERLSFLFGNYITMTNMQDHEIDRIIKMHISPINISVHTTNPQLRVRMLANKRGGEVLKYLPRLVEGGIAVNCQLVLCRGINDGDELRRTLSDLLELTPMVQSIAAVPCGVTDYREKLFKQTPYDAKTSAEVIDIMEEFGDECKRRHGKRIIYPSDEWYLKAGRPIPPEEFYEDFDQLENGVGMMRLYASEFLAELEKPHRIYGTKKMDVVTGEMASPLIQQMMAELHRQYPMIEVTVHTIKNKFFGGNVGVAGLVTATDIIAQCEGKLTSGTLGVPAVMLREEKDTFLDDITTDQLAQRLGVKVEVLPTSGGDEARALLRSGLHIARRRK